MITFVLSLTLAACGGGSSSGSSGGGTGGTTTYTVSAVAGNGGSISPSSRTVNKGATTSFTVSAGPGYLIDKVTGCSGSLSGATYTTGAITGSCTVTASFKAASSITHTVTGSAGTGGQISPASVTVNQGTTASFAITPDSGYRIGGATGCNGSLSGGTYTTGAISGDCTVTASFVAVHTVTVTGGTGGTVSPASKVVDDGGSASIAVTPDAGYGIDTVAGCGGTLSGTTYTTGPITADCTVAATFTVLWTWAGGDNVAKASGAYGPPGTPSTSYIPGAREAPAVWTDPSGDLWLFGGLGYDANGDFGYLSDLWRYDPGTGQWAFMKGSITINAVGRYGPAPGISGTNGGANDTPGARYRAVSWVDANGKLWLFGGTGEDSTTIGTMNDLWVYEPGPGGTGNWTWMGGSSTHGAKGIYGTLGIAGSSNVPGARASAASWIDSAGDFWLFGGNGVDAAGSSGYLNDLWKYDGNEWTWMSGSSTRRAKGTYGTLGLAGSSNVPGARASAASWIDSAGDFWLFGGNGIDAAGSSEYLNDLWKYDGNEWTWMAGADFSGMGGDYGDQGVAAATNIPGSRQSSAVWVDGSDHFWLFGGMGKDYRSTPGQLNDLWEYDIASSEWTWIGGSNTVDATGTYGTLNTPDAANIPGARSSMAAWRDLDGQFWLFGGTEGDDSTGQPITRNDLWKLKP